MPRIEPEPTAEERETLRKQVTARLDEHGPEHVKHLLSIDGLPHHMQAIAVEWLKTKGQS